MIEISVITCSHNPRSDYLQSVVEGLKKQTLDVAKWEYILIDNASDKAIATLVDLSWHPNARHVTEQQLGLTPSRLRGISESNGDILVFVDDDNVLDPDYLEEALAIAKAKPEIGAFSGQVRPSFERTPPEWTRQYWNRLAIREFENDRWSNIPCFVETTPNGAGLCVRRSVADKYAQYHRDGKRNFVLDRTGKSLLSAGDLDLATTSCDLGLGNGLFASLRLMHLMPAWRLTENYLLRLVEDQTFSAVVLGSFRGVKGPTVRRSWKSTIQARLRIIVGGSRDRRFLAAESRGHRRAAAFLAQRPA
jgi:glycosyltransferase involved in cell wall biosynthesis